MKGPFWTTKELAALREHYPKGGSKAVAERINRSVDAIRQAARKYGLTADKDLYKPPPNRYMRKLNESRNSSN